MLNFQHLSIELTANQDPEQRNGFNNPILDFYAESDSLLTHTSGEVHLNRGS